MSDLPTLPLRPSSRRRFLGNATATAAGVAMAGAFSRQVRAATMAPINDFDILNFALNLEYLEAEYYLRGVTGGGLTGTQTSGLGTHGGVVSTPITPRVTFTNYSIESYANEITNDERNHVLFLRAQLGLHAVAEPQIDIGNAFNTLAQAAGIGASFDPYASETNFLIGGFIFEDVGVTAYLGAAPLISNKGYLSAAAAILGVEAYHASLLRTTLNQMALANPAANIYQTTQQISDLRDNLDGPGDDDQPIYYNSKINIVPTDTNALAFARTTTQVLDIVYGNTTASPGLFFPVGMNGTIK